MQQCTIIIPCFNEAKRLNTKTIGLFLEKHPTISILFINDGSRDKTEQVLKQLTTEHKNAHLLNNTNNKGKATSILTGMKKAFLTYKARHYGYLDADLAIPLDTFKGLLTTLESEKKSMCFASKSTLYAQKNFPIKWHRKIMGNILRKCNQFLFKLTISDTQCGAKVFKSTLATSCFTDPFISQWLFDIEVFLRIRKNNGAHFIVHQTKEIPLQTLQLNSGSNVTLKSIVKLPFELAKIYLNYK